MDWEGILTSDSFSEMLGRAYSVSEEHGAGTRGVQGFASYNIDLSKITWSIDSARKGI